MLVIEPLKKVVIDNKAYDVKVQNGKLFGGFCNCGGILKQKFWISVDSGSKKILISECDDCWKNVAMVFNSTKFVEKRDVRVLTRKDMKDFLSEVLSPSEYEAVISKARGDRYNPSAMSRAKKKLSEMNLDVNEILQFLP